MSVVDKLVNFMKLNGEDDDEYLDEDYLDGDEEEIEPAPRKKQQAQKNREEEQKWTRFMDM